MLDDLTSPYDSHDQMPPQVLINLSMLQYGYLSLSYGVSPMATALATRALVFYDLAAGSTTPHLQLAAAVGNQTVLRVRTSLGRG